MSNQSYSKNPKMPPPAPAGGNRTQANPAKIDGKVVGTPQDPIASQEEQLKRILAQMVDKDPANIAEIIHQWLNEDKK